MSDKLESFEIPTGAWELALKRTRPFVHNLQLFDFDLVKLATSVYLQGVGDVALLQLEQESLDYTI